MFVLRPILSITVIVLFFSFLGGCSSKPLVKSQIEEQTTSSEIITKKHNDLVFSVLPYSGEMEQEAFGVNLHRQHIMAVELKVEYNAGEDDRTTFIFRRQDIQLFFDNKQKRYPLDPLKVYERTRINTNTSAFAFGIIGGIAAQSKNKNRFSSFADAAMDQAQLDHKNKAFAGFLFFDLKRIGTGKTELLVIEYENRKTLEGVKVKIKI